MNQIGSFAEIVKNKSYKERYVNITSIACSTGGKIEERSIKIFLPNCLP